MRQLIARFEGERKLAHEVRRFVVHEQEIERRIAHETMFDTVRDQLAQRRGKAVRVEDADRLGMPPDHAAHERFEELFPGAQSARKDGKRIAEILHALLAFAHRSDDNEFVAAAPALLERQELLRDDASDMRAVSLCRACEFAHQPDAAATVDQIEVRLGECAPEVRCRSEVPLIRAACTGTVDRDGLSRGCVLHFPTIAAACRSLSHLSVTAWRLAPSWRSAPRGA